MESLLNIGLQIISVLVIPLLAWYHKLHESRQLQFQQRIDELLVRQQEQITLQMEHLQKLFAPLREDMRSIGDRMYRLEQDLQDLKVVIGSDYVKKDGLTDMTREIHRLGQQISDLRVDVQSVKTEYTKDIALCRSGSGCAT
jgi:tRNA/tmRNA/rRNA uracil-C5-methylase (TrmA/RlmC/RlmD family)